MKGSETRMTAFMEGADKRYIIPVYQRKYDWKQENCRQLYEDLKKVVQTGRISHFFGSIVSSVVPNGSKIEYHIIDGQQRLTTVSLLLLAICNLITKGKLTSREARLDEQIRQRFLIAPWASEEDRIKLRPVKSDREALTKLFGPEEDYDRASNLTLNYLFFRDVLLKEEVPVDELYAAISKLEIISITLEPDDNAQLIFESLNSTGLALTEGDKIRNYILMGLPPREQSRCYTNYWEKIEICTKGDVSAFVRDYLSIKQQMTPNVNTVYHTFKRYAEDTQVPIGMLLEDLLKYARLFEKLLTCESELGEKRLDNCLYRMARLEITVTRPFLLEVLRLNQDGKLSAEAVRDIFEITENYLFRRNVCEVPTNALNKVFLTLNKEILRYDNTADNYVDKFIYALRSKRESGRFPDDREFSDALAAKQVYLMRGKYKAYLFERFENYGTVETKSVYAHLDNNDYSIEHIMPQHLTPAWMEELGTNAAEIHATWLHRLANLTLTGYNPSLSNKTFQEKRDSEQGGYRNSGLRMNQKIALKDAWGLPELEERNQEMVARALQIWRCPQTEFKPMEKEFDSCTLDDEDVDLTGQEIVKYSLLNMEQPVVSWTDMFEHVVKFLHQKDKSVLSTLVYSTSQAKELAVYVSGSESGLRSALKIDDNIYLEKNTSTAHKLSILQRLFALYGVDPMELVFYLKDLDGEKMAESNRFELRKRYWSYALPVIQKQHMHRGSFANTNPTSSNVLSGFFRMSGFSIECIANYDGARVDFYLGSDMAKNKAAFDLLYSHKDEIEDELGITLTWERADKYKASWLSYALKDISIANEADWPRMARFHAEWSDAICNAVLPYLQKEDEVEKRLSEVAGVLREWTVSQPEIKENLARCNRTLTRFTTEQMSEIFPDLPGAPSGWGTDNHYFYEIVNRTGDKVYIQLALSSKNATEDFLEICDHVSALPIVRPRRDGWKWWTIFRTESVDIGVSSDKQEIFAKLNLCIEQVWAFEKELKQALAE